MKFEKFQQLVHTWAEQRGIYAHSTAVAQLLKAVSEMGELADAEIKQDAAGQLDGVGDVIVCLINYARLAGIDIEESFDYVWHQLEKRTGTISSGGAFVKDG